MGETMRPLRAALIALSGAALALGAGCGSDPEPSPQFGGYVRPPNPYATNGYSYNPGYGLGYVIPVPSAQGALSDSPTSSSVHIDERILRACGDLPTAHFAFDSANVLPESASALDALARCFVSGPLQGKSLRLVGHADPRGETEYNLGLGHQRAYSVVDILAQRGVPMSRMSTSSKGEFEASGVDEMGWARDRKVEVILVD